MPEFIGQLSRGGRRFRRCCRSSVLWFIVVVGLVFVLSVEAGAFDNVQYLIRNNPLDSTADTLGMIALRSEPRLMEPIQVDVEWYRGFSRSDSVVVRAGNGSCNFLWDKTEHVWYGDFGPGDVLRTSFQVTPIRVGALKLQVDLIFGPRQWSWMSIDFTLDEHGNRIEPEPGLVYGRLGPIPDAGVSHLHFLYGCYQSTKDFATEQIWMRGRLQLPLQSSSVSRYDCVLVPTSDFTQGIYYQVDYNDVLQVQLVDSSDWPHHVSAGDSLRVGMNIIPKRPGIGRITLRAVGFNPIKEPSSERGVDNGGFESDFMRVYLVIDKDLTLIASSSYRLPDPSQVDLADAYRWPAVESLMGESLPRIISSENYDSLAVPLRRQYYEAKGY